MQSPNSQMNEGKVAAHWAGSVSHLPPLEREKAGERGESVCRSQWSKTKEHTRTSYRSARWRAAKQNTHTWRVAFHAAQHAVIITHTH